MPRTTPPTSSDDLAARLPRVVDLLAARAEEHDREGGFPYQGVEVVHEAGLLLLGAPPRQGGGGAGPVELVRVLVELGRGDPSVALLVADTLVLHAAQARRRIWPELLYRGLVAESKRRPVLLGVLPAPELTARRTEDGLRLGGRVERVSGADALDWFAFEVPGKDAGTFLVPGDAPGLRVEHDWEQLGLRAGSGHDLLLEDVPVTEEALLPGEPDAYLQVLRYLVGPAVGLGIARSARDWLLFRLRRQGLAPTVALGRIEAELLGAEEQLDGLAARLDRADPSTPRRAALLRLPLLDAAERALRAVVGLSGPAALTTRHPLERQLRDLLALRAQLPPEEQLFAEAGAGVLAPGTDGPGADAGA
ncbi:acyl-CoA dehydrogenase family protein [Streptacidiphilus monticola]|uniref:Acyl-CoA dehydrogenase family protein n=1 Tax=Streptacidiphilus monticola TaxID=2161674 RepID=A0ABW1FVX1_9ACTN